jgi:hypothetical protein
MPPRATAQWNGGDFRNSLSLAAERQKALKPENRDGVRFLTLFVAVVQILTATPSVAPREPLPQSSYRVSASQLVALVQDYWQSGTRCAFRKAESESLVPISHAGTDRVT